MYTNDSFDAFITAKLEKKSNIINHVCKFLDAFQFILHRKSVLKVRRKIPMYVSKLVSPKIFSTFVHSSKTCRFSVLLEIVAFGLAIADRSATRFASCLFFFYLIERHPFENFSRALSMWHLFYRSHRPP